MWVHGINVDHWPTIIAIIRCLDFVYIYTIIVGEKLELWIFLLELLRGVNQLNYKTIDKDFITSKVKMLSRERGLVIKLHSFMWHQVWIDSSSWCVNLDSLCWLCLTEYMFHPGVDCLVVEPAQQASTII